MPATPKEEKKKTFSETAAMICMHIYGVVIATVRPARRHRDEAHVVRHVVNTRVGSGLNPCARTVIYYLFTSLP